ncbi:hypothetical protein TIFTF001_018511 [Ficus carica]|uniref:Uncharacterized protein n=1 Tax=Ficus carica TaxID=3494 RepID=A0AA88AE48_FICCA|nr:hypothetical protein TIFTF001_018511 [Ficus carica]
MLFSIYDVQDCLEKGKTSTITTERSRAETRDERREARNLREVDRWERATSMVRHGRSIWVFFPWMDPRRANILYYTGNLTRCSKLGPCWAQPRQ